MRSNHKSQKFLKELKSFWEVKNIPADIQNIYLDAFNNLTKSQLQEFLRLEIENTKNDKSPIVLCLQSILAREDSIKSIKRLNISLHSMQDWYLMEEIITECAEIFEAYRSITLTYLENFNQWKKQMADYLNSPHVDIVYSGCSYREIMKNSMDFLLDSEFGMIFNFVKEDPLLLKCSRVLETAQNYCQYRSRFYLTIDHKLYDRLVEIEGNINSSINNDFMKKKISVKINDNEVQTNKSLTPVRQSAQSLHLKSTSSARRNVSVKSIKIKKSDYKFIDKVLEDYYSKKLNQRNFESSSKSPQSRDTSSHKLDDNFVSDESENARKSSNKRFINSKSSIRTRKLPPLQSSKIKELETSENLRSKSINLRKNKKQEVNNSETETKIFISIERTVENSQIADEILNNLLKILIKKTDLYSLAYNEIADAKKEDMLKQKKILDENIAIFIADDIVEFYLKCCNLEAIITLAINCYLEDKKAVTRIVENIQISEEILYELIDGCIVDINYEEIVEDCISLNLQFHENAVKSLKNLKTLTKNQISFLSESFFNDLVASFLHTDIVLKSIEENQEKVPLDSSEILLKYFPSFSLQSENINILLYSDIATVQHTKDTTEFKEEMLKTGSRLILMAAIILKIIDPFYIISKNRLQKDFIDLFRIYVSLPEPERLLTQNSFHLSLPLPVPQLKIDDLSYFFLANIPETNSSDSKSYQLATTNPDFSIFFISCPNLLSSLRSEVASFKYDLFSKVESLMLQDSSSETTANLLVPFFSKHTTWNVSWIEGLQLTESSYIDTCVESILLNFSSKPKTSESFVLKPPFTYISPPFIFGVIHNPTFTSLQVPLSVGLIETEDLIRA